MTEKPLSGDPEQRAQQTRAAREQSGLPREEESSESEQASSGERAKSSGAKDDTETQSKER